MAEAKNKPIDEKEVAWYAAATPGVAFGIPVQLRAPGEPPGART